MEGDRRAFFFLSVYFILSFLISPHVLLSFFLSFISHSLSFCLTLFHLFTPFLLLPPSLPLLPQSLLLSFFLTPSLFISSHCYFIHCSRVDGLCYSVWIDDTVPDFHLLSLSISVCLYCWCFLPLSLYL